MKTKKVIENKQEKNNDITAELKLFSLHEERLKLEEELLEIESLLKGAAVYEDLESKTIKTDTKILNTINQQKNGMRMNNVHICISICTCRYR
jgi:DnaJ-domain-containing protein 1